ncbi:MAG: glycosyltransferase, partial [Bdellovibrionota bacterium]
YRRAITDELRLYGELHRFIVVLAEGVGARVTELETHHRPRVAGVSKYGLSRTLKVVLDLTTIWFMRGFKTKPIYLFGTIGAALMGLGALSAVFVLWQKIALSVWVHRNPLLIVAVMFTVLGVQFLALGLIAEIVIRTYFETHQKPAYSVSERLGFEDQRPKTAHPAAS